MLNINKSSQTKEMTVHGQTDRQLGHNTKHNALLILRLHSPKGMRAAHDVINQMQYLVGETTLLDCSTTEIKYTITAAKKNVLSDVGLSARELLYFHPVCVMDH